MARLPSFLRPSPSPSSSVSRQDHQQITKLREERARSQRLLDDQEPEPRCEIPALAEWSVDDLDHVEAADRPLLIRWVEQLLPLALQQDNHCRSVQSRLTYLQEKVIAVDGYLEQHTQDSTSSLEEATSLCRSLVQANKEVKFDQVFKDDHYSHLRRIARRIAGIVEHEHHQQEE